MPKAVNGFGIATISQSLNNRQLMDFQKLPRTSTGILAT
jgi:hypothetical protein